MTDVRPDFLAQTVLYASAEQCQDDLLPQGLVLGLPLPFLSFSLSYQVNVYFERSISSAGCGESARSSRYQRGTQRHRFCPGANKL